MVPGHHVAGHATIRAYYPLRKRGLDVGNLKLHLNKKHDKLGDKLEKMESAAAYADIAQRKLLC